ncbi:MAG: OmpH family outer membrane protein [Candidatus Omnitrophota bacterium]
MRTKKFLMMFLAIIALSFFCSSLAMGANKVGYIDLGKVFDDYQKAKDFDTVLEKEKQEMQTKRDQMVADIRKLKDGLELLNEEAKAKKQEGIDQKIKDLQDFDREVSTELKQKYDSKVREILKEIDNTIKEYGAKEKFDIIFDDRALLYGDESMDATSPILKILNANYKGKP